jgi:hypothetical protein
MYLFLVIVSATAVGVFIGLKLYAWSVRRAHDRMSHKIHQLINRGHTAEEAARLAGADPSVWLHRER